MANKVKECNGKTNAELPCAYNTTKKAGGFGKICNGSTMKSFGRCPEWRISEAIRNGVKDTSNVLPRGLLEIDI